MLIDRRYESRHFAGAILGGVLLLLFAGPSRAETACVVGVPNWDVLWIRTGPGVRFARAKDIPANACGVQIAGVCERGWCRVSYAGVGGWANVRYLGRAGGSGDGTACVVGVANSDVLWLRTGPGPNFNPIDAIPARACGVRITGPCEKRWCRVTFGGLSGWVNTSYLQ